MKALTLLAALAASAHALAGEIVIQTDAYQLTAHECRVDAMTWIEPPGRAFGKVGGHECSRYTIRFIGRPSPAEIEPNATASIFGNSALWFECMVTGLSTDPYRIDLWCADDPLFRGRK